MTKRKTQPEKNPPEAFAAAFKGIGGIPALIRWAKSSSHNRAAFYQMFSKLFPVEMKTEVNAKLTVEDQTKTNAEFDKLIEGIVAMRMQKALIEQGSGGPEGVMMFGGVTYKHRGGKWVDAQTLTIDNGPQPLQQSMIPEPQPQTTQQSVEPAPQSPAAVPDNVVPLHEKPFHPGARPEPSATELYLDWIGSRRSDPWGNHS
jgi:hypothetical protein